MVAKQVKWKSGTVEGTKKIRCWVVSHTHMKRSQNSGRGGRPEGTQAVARRERRNEEGASQGKPPPGPFWTTPRGTTLRRPKGAECTR